MIEGVLCGVQLPGKFIVIAAQWPAWLVTLIALHLPIQAAYFPSKYHCFFKSKDWVTCANTFKLLETVVDPTIIYLVSGSVHFVDKLRSWFGELGLQRSIISLEIHRRGSSRSEIRSARIAGSRLLQDLHLREVSFVDNECGGATDVTHDFGFGRNIGSLVLPRPEVGLPLCVRHFLDGGANISGMSTSYTPRSSVPPITNPRRAVLWYDKVLRPEGLFPSQNPNARVYCPKYDAPNAWVVRNLTCAELLRLYQLPLSLDHDFAKTQYDFQARSQDWVPPFENSPSSVILTSCVRQLWGVSGGGKSSSSLSTQPLSAEACNSVVPTEYHNVRQGGRDRGSQCKSLERTYKNHTSGIMTVKRPDTPLCESTTDSDEMDAVLEIKHASEGGSGGGSDPVERMRETRSSSRMTVAGSDMLLGDPAIYLVEEEATLMEEEEMEIGIAELDQLSDGSSETSLASAETVRWQHATKHDPELDMERGPPLQFEPGPPFAVGHIIMCDPAGCGLQPGLVLRADHPSYLLSLEDGRQVDTAVSPTGIFPFYAQWEGNTNNLACYVEPPLFVKLRSEYCQVGSYGTHVDAQHTALQLVNEAKDYAKAVKADDAEIPVYLWNNRIPAVGATAEALGSALTSLRKLGWRWYIKVLLRDCIRYMREEHGDNWPSKPRYAREGITEVSKDQSSIVKLLWHSTQTDWFEYNAGSKLVHFRFPKRYRKLARDGVPIFFEKPGPTTRGFQPRIADSVVRDLTREKVAKVLQRRYLCEATTPVRSFIKYFAVPKGVDDVRIVYDATANGLNECVWSPPFWLPTINTLVCGLDENSWMTDRDMADMFLNFQLHSSAVPFTGVRLSSLYEASDKIGVCEAVWDRNLMGFAPSPYNSVKMARIVEDICKGDRHQIGKGIDGRELNPFQWESVKLNLPGVSDYDPCVTWISKRRKDGRIACDVYTFVDDERVTGPDEDLTWQASHVLASKQSYVGIQDAARKARPCSKSPGAWAGSVVHIVPDLGVCVLTSEDKWNKMKEILKKWKKVLDTSHTQLSHKELLSDRGFLVYATRSYPAMIPYLKGFHLTAEMWRGGRDVDGWKLKQGGISSGRLQNVLLDVGESQLGTDNELLASVKVIYAPIDGFTTQAPRFKDDIAALLRLTNFALPPLRVVRPSRVVNVYYGFGDASGKQFGATVSKSYNCMSSLSQEAMNDKGLRFRIGLWSANEEEESSNYKELRNLVDTIAGEARSGRMRNSEFFLFTDNSTAEDCFYTGTSKSRLLHSLVLSLRLLELEFGMTLHVIHISGKRMIAQGTDGCSRGSLNEGVMAGEDMLNFVNLGQSAIERCPCLLDWIRAWTGRPKLMPLSPEGWFEEGHGIVGGSLDHNKVWMPTYGKGGGLFLWSPPPAIADVALEEMLKARHKRSDTFHVVVVPRIMSPRWRRLFRKACDFLFVVSPGSDYWPFDMFEPLWVGILLPFVKHRPWCLKRAPVLLEFGRKLRGMLETGEGDERNILRQLTLLPGRVDSLPFHLACGVLHMPRAGNLEVPSI